MFSHGRLAGTGYLSILPVDQGIEHSAGASFAKNTLYFDPENIVKLAIEGGCNAVASTLGGLGMVARKYAHRIPFLLKINHNEFLSYPNKFDQIMFARTKQAWDMGAVAVGATVYFGSPESTRQIQEVSVAFQQAHELGMATVLWCYLRNPAFKTAEKDFHVSAALTGQATHPGVPIEPDTTTQKLRQNNNGYQSSSTKESPYARSTSRCTTSSAPPTAIDWTLPGGELLHRARGPHQLRRRLLGESDFGSGEDSRHQQGAGGTGPHLRPQGLPAADGGRRPPAQRVQDVYLGERSSARTGASARVAVHGDLGKIRDRPPPIVTSRRRAPH